MKSAIRQTKRQDIIYFTAYLKIYGKNGRFLTDVLEHMVTNTDELTDTMLKEIETYLVNKSKIDTNRIRRTKLYLIDEEATY